MTILTTTQNLKSRSCPWPARPKNLIYCLCCRLRRIRSISQQKRHPNLRWFLHQNRPLRLSSRDRFRGLQFRPQRRWSNAARLRKVTMTVTTMTTSHSSPSKRCSSSLVIVFRIWNNFQFFPFSYNETLSLVWFLNTYVRVQMNKFTNKHCQFFLPSLVKIWLKPLFCVHFGHIIKNISIWLIKCRTMLSYHKLKNFIGD